MSLLFDAPLAGPNQHFSLPPELADTTSVTLTFALFLLAQNPQVQEHLVQELQVVKSTENVDDLVYCKAVIWETLRLFPAAVRTNRVLAKPVQLSGGFVAPEGCRINIPIWSIHRDEKNFPRPEEFLPARWAKRDDEKNRWVERHVGEEIADEDDIAAGDHKAMIAFSAGGRNCVGQKFATQEAIIVLATLVKDLKFSPSPDYKLELKQEIVLKPVNGMLLKVEARA
jgi:cytochrome P450 family 4